MNNFEKMPNCLFTSGRLSLRYFEYVNKLFGSLSSHNFENQQITAAKYTVLMLRVHQNEHKKALAGRCRTKSITWAKIFGCSRVIAHRLMRRFEQTGISIDA